MLETTNDTVERFERTRHFQSDRSWRMRPSMEGERAHEQPLASCHRASTLLALDRLQVGGRLKVCRSTYCAQPLHQSSWSPSAISSAGGMLAGNTRTF